MPANFKNKAFPFNVILTAANNSAIKTYGCVTTELTIKSLRRNFVQTFIVADVNMPILGADFFSKHNLLINVRDKCLLDQTTQFSFNMKPCSANLSNVNNVSCLNKNLLHILSKHEHTFNILSPRPTPKVTFKIDTHESPKPFKPYRLSSDKTEAAKHEINKVIDLVRMPPSSSDHSSSFSP